MKEIDDEELQKLIEQQFSNKTENASFRYETEDKQLYRALFTALAQEPPVTRTPLADDVVAMIEQQQKAEERNYSTVIAMATAASLLFAVVALAVMSPNTLSEIAGLVNRNLAILLFVISAFAGIQYLDKKLVKPHSAA
jgi:hypothetical protein